MRARRHAPKADESLPHLAVLDGTRAVGLMRTRRTATRFATSTLDARFFFFSQDVQPSRQIAMASELSIFAPLRQALLYCFQFYQ
jgi:hypothetical protein